MSIKDQLRQRLEQNQRSHRSAPDLTRDDSRLEVEQLIITRITTNPFQPRSVFDVEAIEALAQSIERDGLVQPIVVRPNGALGYQLISGERRLRAFQELGREEIPAIISPMSDEESAVAALQENLKREDLSDFEVGEALNRLRALKEDDSGPLNVTQLAELISVSRPAVYRYLSFLSLPEAVRARLSESPELISGSTSLALERWRSAEGAQASDARYKSALLKVLDQVESGLKQSQVLAQVKATLESPRGKKKSDAQAPKPLRRKLTRDGQTLGRLVESPEEFKITLRRDALSARDLKRVEQLIQSLMDSDT